MSDSIFQTKWGAYVDLSKIVSVEYGHPDGFELSIQFQLVEGKTGFDLNKNRIADEPWSNEDDLNNLVNAWKEYKVEQPELQPRI